jgi:GntR family transcriptional regulator
MRTLSTLRLEIDPASRRPVYLQLADSVRRQRALGRAQPGQRLPSIRDLAKEMELDPSTVARAYQELERDAVIVSQRGRGSFIADSAPRHHQPLVSERRRRMEHAVERAILEGLGLGFNAGELKAAFTRRLTSWRTPSGGRKNARYNRAVPLMEGPAEVYPDLS